MRRRLDVGEIELGDLADGLEDRAELLLDARDLGLGYLEARESRHVQDVFATDGHVVSLEVVNGPPRGAEPAGLSPDLPRDYTACTFAAWRPFVPSTISNSTRCPSRSDL